MLSSLTLPNVKHRKLAFSIGVVWLFHISGMIGITLGFHDWFITKTPLNLIIAFVLLAWNYPIHTAQHWLMTGTFFGAGMLAEWIGVHNDFLFGPYDYGSNLGIKLDGVPLLIGINWALLTLITGTIAHKVASNLWVKVIFGAFLMVFLDSFLELPATKFDFWYWEIGQPPLRNFITWFLLSALLHVILQRYRFRGNFTFCLHLYAAQLIFFAYFYGYYRL